MMTGRTTKKTISLFGSGPNFSKKGKRIKIENGIETTKQNNKLNESDIRIKVDLFIFFFPIFYYQSNNVYMVLYKTQDNFISHVDSVPW